MYSINTIIANKKYALIKEEFSIDYSIEMESYIDDLINSNSSIVMEGFTTDIKTKLSKLLKNILDLIKSFIKKLDEIRIKLFKRMKNPNLKKENDEITDEFLYKKYGNDYYIKYFIPSKPDSNKVLNYFNDLNSLCNDLILTLSNKENHTHDMEKTYKNKFNILRSKYNIESPKDIKELTYQVYLSSYKNENSDKKSFPLNQFPLDIVDFYLSDEEKIKQDNEKITNKIRKVKEEISSTALKLNSSFRSMYDDNIDNDKIKLNAAYRLTILLRLMIVDMIDLVSGMTTALIEAHSACVQVRLTLKQLRNIEKSERKTNN